MPPIESLEQFRQYIVDGVDADLNELPRGMSVAWFPNPSSPTRATMFTMNEPPPFDSFSVVIGIFHGEHTIRIYTMPRDPPNPRPTDWQARMPTRYTLSRAAATYVGEVMTLDAQAQAIVDECNAIAGDRDTAEDELEGVLDFIEKQGPMIDRDKLLRQLTDGEHHGDEDEPEEKPKLAVFPPPQGAPS